VSYIGVQPTAGQYRKLDDISASFNGSTTSFTTSVGGTNVTAGTAQQLLVSVGGVIQEPDADYTVSTNTITFTTAPASGLDFFAVLMGDALNTVTTSDGSITTAKLAGSLSVGLAAGTNSAPSLYFTGDSNTGVYSPGADQVAVTTGGTQRLSIDSSGNVNIDSNTLYVDAANNRVGIGSTSPSRKLVVSNSGAEGFEIGPGESSNLNQQLHYNRSSSAYVTNRIDAADHLFWISGSEKARIDSSGRVGIGTNSPSALLDVVGSSNTLSLSSTSTDATTKEAKITCRHYTNSEENAMLVYGASTSTDNAVILGGGSSAQNCATYIQFITAANNTTTSGTERARIDSSGRLLVGTSSARSNFFRPFSATAAVQLEGTSGNLSTLSVVRNSNDSSSSYFVLGKSRGTANASNTIVQNGDAIGGISFQGTDGGDLTEAARISAEVDGTPGTADMPGRLIFSTTADGASSPTERMRITSTGVLFCGYDFRDATLESTDQLKIGGNGYTAFHALNGTAYTIGQNSNSRALRIGSGSGWATTGVSLAAGGTSWGTYSDERLKQDIAELDGCLDQLSGIRCVTYRLKDVDEADSKKRLGVIAQDLEGKFDEALNASRRTEDDVNEYLSVQYADLVPVLIKSLQEAKGRIETLEAEVAALKGA
jgi:hypothetical protein